MQEKIYLGAFPPALAADIQRSRSGNFKKNGWTEWMDRRIFREKQMAQGLTINNYQQWLNFYFRLLKWNAPDNISGIIRKIPVPDKIRQDPLLIPIKSIEEMIGKRPLWALSFAEKGFDITSLPGTLYQPVHADIEFDDEGIEDSVFIERERFSNVHGGMAIVERNYRDRDRKFLDFVTVVTEIKQGLIVYIDDLEKRHSYQYRTDTFLLELDDVTKIEPLVKLNKRISSSLLNSEFGNYRINGYFNVNLT